MGGAPGCFVDVELGESSHDPSPKPGEWRLKRLKFHARRCAPDQSLAQLVSRNAWWLLQYGNPISSQDNIAVRVVINFRRMYRDNAETAAGIEDHIRRKVIDDV